MDIYGISPGRFKQFRSVSLLSDLNTHRCLVSGWMGRNPQGESSPAKPGPVTYHNRASHLMSSDYSIHSDP